MPHYDVIVLGTGGVGAAALFHLARRGVRVLGLDRFPPGHDRGSSHGQSRIIRLAYFEHPSYVPLLRRAYELWNELENLSGQKLYHETGLLMAGFEHGEVIPGVLRSASEHSIPIEKLSATESRRRFPAHLVPEGQAAVFEPRAGFLRVEPCVEAHANLSVQAGAELRTNVTIHDWKTVGSLVTVTTSEGNFTADRLVIAAGAWATDLLKLPQLSLQVLRKPVFWYRTKGDAYRLRNNAPCFLFEAADGIYYGFPQLEDAGVKLAEHSGGQPVADPLQVDRTLHDTDRERIERYIAAYLPQLTRDCTRHSVCLYTMSPDGHFIVGQHPAEPRVCFTAGLSGHGFKFTSVLGEVLADLALNGTTTQPIDFLSPARFQ